MLHGSVCRGIAVLFLTAILSVCLPAPTAAAAAKRRTPSGPLRPRYEKWIDEDVRWIITPEEKEAFQRLRTNQDRDRFIAEFWVRRNPHPGRADNEYKEEHYRRMAYANEHFGCAIPGDKTDRGRIYILYGPPDAIRDNPERTGNVVHRQQTWLYHSLPDDRKNVEFSFVEGFCDCDCLQLSLAPTGK
jgi:GWxTD domain-containing protein